MLTKIWRILNYRHQLDSIIALTPLIAWLDVGEQYFDIIFFSVAIPITVMKCYFLWNKELPSVKFIWYEWQFIIVLFLVVILDQIPFLIRFSIFLLSLIILIVKDTISKVEEKKGL